MKVLEENEYTNTETVSTLTPEEVALLTLSMAQRGLLRKWAQDLTSKPTPGPKPKSQDKAEKADKSQATTAQDVRGDAAMMALVDQRIKQLGVVTIDEDESDDEDNANGATSKHTKGKKKSGRKRTSCDIVKRAIDWPHFHVYRGPGRKPVEFDTLTLAEFTYGYLCVQRDADDVDDQIAMTTHLRLLMADATEFGWPAVRNYHGVLLQLMEQRNFSWSQDSTQLREQYLKSCPATSTTEKAGSGQERPWSGATDTKRYCGPYQAGKCQETGPEHDSPRGTVHHICSFCLRRAGKPCNHPESRCMRKGFMAGKDTGAAAEER